MDAYNAFHICFEYGLDIFKLNSIFGMYTEDYICIVFLSLSGMEADS